MYYLMWIALSFCFRVNRNNATITIAAVEFYHTVNESEECVVLTHTHVLAGIVNSTALTHDDVACYAGLTTPNLNA